MAKKSLIIAALAAFLSMGTLFSAYGQEKAITSIPLTFSWDTAPKGGELVGLSLIHISEPTRPY